MADSDSKIRKLDDSNDCCSPMPLSNEDYDIDTLQLSIKAGLDVNNPDKNGILPIFAAVQKKRLDIVELLIKAGADVNLIWCNSTPLHLVEDPAIAEALLKHGARIDSIDGSGRTPLDYAVEKNQLDIVELLIKNEVVFFFNNKYLDMPLHAAVKMNNVNIAKALITEGADVGFIDKLGMRPIYYAISNKSLAMLDLLLESGADPNLLSAQEEKRPIDMAIKECDLDIVARLIAANASVDPAKTINFSSLKTVGDNSFGTLQDLIKKNLHLTDARHVPNRYDIDSLRGNHQLYYKLCVPKTEVVKCLLNAGCDVRLSDSDENPLLQAARQNNLNEVEALLNSGIDPNGVNWLKRTALHLAVEKCNLSMIACLIASGANVDAIDNLGNFPLLMAVEKNHIDILQYLLESQANVNTSNNEGITSLHRAAVKTVNMDILTLLLKTGCNVHALDHHGNTPLHVAVHQNDMQKVEALLNSGADPNTPNRSGRQTSLHLAVENDNLEMVMRLVAAGADVNCKDLLDNFPLLLAIENSSFDLTKYLVESGADIRSRDKNGATCLHIALVYKSRYMGFKITEFLLKVGCDVNAFDDNQTYPLHKAVESRNLGITKLLIRYGANVNCCNHYGETVLHIAAKKSWFEGMVFLMKKNVNLKIENANKKTAFCCSLENFQKSMIKCAVLLNRTSDTPKIYCNSDLRKYQIETFKMQHHYLGESRISLCNLLKEDNEDKLASFFTNVSNEPLSSIKAMYIEPYVEYSTWIMNQLKIGKTRELLLRKSELIMQHSMLAELPPLIRVKISQLLSNIELEYFAFAALGNIHVNKYRC